MDLIIETDLGRDPDDFFAICYLVSAGVNIRAITISPGDEDQVAVAKFLCKELGLDIPVGSATCRKGKSSVGGVHVEILKKYGFPERMNADDSGAVIIQTARHYYPDAELFACGPLQSVGNYLRKDASHTFSRATMQGGYVSYDVYPPLIRLPKFEGQATISTFNLNGDVDSGLLFARANFPKQFVGKNVCHTIEYGHMENSWVTQVSSRNRAMELFREGMNMYLRKHNVKLFHDPTAAVCHLHPEIGTWIDGKLYREKGKWGTVPGGNDKMLVEIDRTKLWDHIAKGT